MKKQIRRGLLPAGIFCALGAALLLAPGIRFSGYFFLGVAALFLVWSTLGYLAEKHRFFKLCKRVFLAGVCALAVLLSCLEAVIISCGETYEPALPVDAVIVLGAGVNGETPSLTLQTRIDMAAEYIADHGDVPIVLSGGQGSGENISEAEAMYRALRKSPLRPTDTPFHVLLEDRSTSTAENFACSKALLEEQGVDTERAVIAVVTNDFHMYRSRLIAGEYGLNTIGVPAELPWWWLTANYYLRESFALVKTLLFDI